MKNSLVGLQSRRKARGCELVLRNVLCLMCFACLLASGPSSARGTERLGTVNFPTSCPQVQETLNQGLALLHSFQYEQAEQSFTQAASADATCAMAYWGKAMALYHQLWDFPNAQLLAEGRSDLEQAQQMGRQSPREREYIASAAVFFKDDPKWTPAERVGAYSAAMDKLYRDYPEDNEAGEFYALSLISLAQIGTDDQRYRLLAISILNPIFSKYPNDPGAAHYLIHAADTPDLASQGLAAARVYARIAPDSAHAFICRPIFFASWECGRR
jgi:hypothetical protein